MDDASLTSGAPATMRDSEWDRRAPSPTDYSVTPLSHLHIRLMQRK